MRTAILFSILIIFTLMGCNFGDGNILIVPKNFKGYIVIIYDQKAGLLPKRHGNKTVYEIPDDGILKVQTEVNSGWREPNEYYYEKIAPENKLPSYDVAKEMPTGLTVGFEGAFGNANKDLAGNERIPFSLFYIGTKSEIEQYKDQAEKLDIVKLAE